ncbi:MAG: hypothetical protein LUG17_00730 [Clostridiales bacterium]|nr:hypothetical protein [Clostridiales bacterium]
MKRKCKQLTALVLALAMCLSLLSATAWAADLSAEAELATEEVQEDLEPVAGEADAAEEEADEEAQSDEEAAPAEEEATVEAAEVQEETSAEETEEETLTDESEATVSASSAATESYSTTYINPLYADVITEDDLVQPSEDEGNALVRAASNVEYCTTIEEAGEQFREEMKKRTETITVYYLTTEAITLTTYRDIFNAAVEHTGDPEEGDYLLHQYGGWSAGGSHNTSGGNYYYTLTYTMTYFTTAEQEAEVTAKLETVMDSLDLDSKCDYQKIQAIYDYICDNVTYDYDNLNDDDYDLKYTAYAALINGTSVCQGYSVLFYRMALEAGIDARYISGTATNSAGSTGAHAWDIVKLGNYYYNVDTTWDEASYLAGIDYRYFLLGEDNFNTNHFRSSTYSTDEFYEAYPMSDSDYPEDMERVDFSTCTVTLSATSYTYDGSAKKPTVTVTDADGNTLTKGTDYTVAYSDNTNVGTATVTVIGAGNYTGTVEKTFTISKATMSVTKSNYSGTYDGSAHTFTLSVSGPSSYTIYYSKTTKLTSSNYSSTGTTTKPTRVSLGQTTVYYYVKDNTGNYSDASGTAYIYLRPEVTATAFSGTYDGSTHSATITTTENATLYYSKTTKLTYSNYSTSGTTTNPTRLSAGTTTVYYIAVPTSGTVNANTVTTGKTTITLSKADMTVSKTNYSGTYDGWAHTFTLKVSGPSSYTIYYSKTTQLTSSNYSTTGTTTKPTRTGVGQTKVYYYVKDGTGNYSDASGTVYIYIRPVVTVTAYSGVYDGSTHSATVTVTGNATLYYSKTTKLTYSNYSTSGTTTNPTRLSAGTTTVYYIAVPTSGTVNANTVTTGKTTITLSTADMTVTKSNYSGTYDGSAHTFTLSVSGPSSYTVYYSKTTKLTSSNYSNSGTTTKPTRVSLGQTTVYYYIEDNTGNYNDASGSAYIYLRPEVTATAYSGAYDGSAHSATITVTGNATLYYSKTTKLTYSNYSTSGTTTNPTRVSAGTTTVYYIAVPNSGTVNANTVTTGKTTITLK